MKYYDEIKESLYLQCVDTNNLCGCTMSENLSVNGFKWEKHQ